MGFLLGGFNPSLQRAYIRNPGRPAIFKRGEPQRIAWWLTTTTTTTTTTTVNSQGILHGFGCI